MTAGPEQVASPVDRDVVAVAGGLMAFTALGSFSSSYDAFAHSVLVPAGDG